MLLHYNEIVEYLNDFVEYLSILYCYYPNLHSTLIPLDSRNFQFFIVITSSSLKVSSSILKVMTFQFFIVITSSLCSTRTILAFFFQFFIVITAYKPVRLEPGASKSLSILYCYYKTIVSWLWRMWRDTFNSLLLLLRPYLGQAVRGFYPFQFFIVITATTSTLQYNINHKYFQFFIVITHQESHGKLKQVETFQFFIVITQV